MAKLVSFLLSQHSQSIPMVGAGNVQQLIGPTTIIRPKYIPSEHSFSITLGINDIDLTQENVLRLVLVSPSGVRVIDTGDGPLPVAVKDSVLPEDVQGFLLTFPAMNINLPEEGKYTLQIILNNTCLEEREIPVYKQEEKK